MQMHDTADNKAFAKGGEFDLSDGPAQNRGCTDPIFLAIFIVHIALFWIFSMQGASYGNPVKLVAPRDWKGQYCGIATNWNGGDDMSGHENMIYTLNISATIDSIAEEFVCSSAVKTLMTSSATPAQYKITEQDFDDVYCAGSGFSGLADDMSSMKDSVESKIARYTTPEGATNLLLGNGGSSPLSAFTQYFVGVCVTECGLTSDAATRSYTYVPSGDQVWRPLFLKTMEYANSDDFPASSAADITSLLDQFKFNALPESACPYADAKMCVPLPVITFTELYAGYCTIDLTAGALGGVSDYLVTVMNGVAKSDIAKDAAGSLEAAVGDIQNTWASFVVVALFSFVLALVVLILIRWLVGPFIWLSLLAAFAMFCAGGLLCFVYSSMCDGADFSSAAESLASEASDSAGASDFVGNLSTQECGGLYQVQDEGARDVLKVCGVVMFVGAAMWACTVLCLCSRIKLMISISEVAALFVVQTPHIVLVPIIQGLGAIIWCAIWMLLASFLLSQVPDDYVPTECFNNYADAYGAYDSGGSWVAGQCTDSWPQGMVWKNDTSTACIETGCCWMCAPPRYIFDHRFAFSFFSFLWHNAFWVALGQCTVAGAVGIWFFKNGVVTSMFSVCSSVKNALLWHAGSLAFGSFVLAVVQFIRWFFYYLSKQAEAQKNKAMECVFKCLMCCVHCFEKCIKFLNKNAYIQVALMGTNFCVSCKNAFWLIFRNAVRFAMITGLGAALHMFGKFLIMGSTGVIGFLVVQSMNPEISTPVVQVILYIVIGYFMGSLFMNVYGLAIDTVLHCYIATEEMRIPKEFVPKELHQFISATTKEAKENDASV